jgi:hypothetical protein
MSRIIPAHRSNILNVIDLAANRSVTAHIFGKFHGQSHAARLAHPKRSAILRIEGTVPCCLQQRKNIIEIDWSRIIYILSHDLSRHRLKFANWDA